MLATIKQLSKRNEMDFMIRWSDDIPHKKLLQYYEKRYYWYQNCAQIHNSKYIINKYNNNYFNSLRTNIYLTNRTNFENIIVNVKSIYSDIEKLYNNVIKLEQLQIETDHLEIYEKNMKYEINLSSLINFIKDNYCLANDTIKQYFDAMILSSNLRIYCQYYDIITCVNMNDEIFSNSIVLNNCNHGNIANIEIFKSILLSIIFLYENLISNISKMNSNIVISGRNSYDVAMRNLAIAKLHLSHKQ